MVPLKTVLTVIALLVYSVVAQDVAPEETPVGVGERATGIIFFIFIYSMNFTLNNCFSQVAQLLLLEDFQNLNHF